MLMGLYLPESNRHKPEQQSAVAAYCEELEHTARAHRIPLAFAHLLVDTEEFISNRKHMDPAISITSRTIRTVDSKYPRTLDTIQFNIEEIADRCLETELGALLITDIQLLDVQAKRADRDAIVGLLDPAAHTFLNELEIQGNTRKKRPRALFNNIGLNVALIRTGWQVYVENFEQIWYHADIHNLFSVREVHAAAQASSNFINAVNNTKNVASLNWMYTTLLDMSRLEGEYYEQ